jgi:hypothetical protein
MCVLFDLVWSEGRIDRHRYGSGHERAKEDLEERCLCAEHECDGVAAPDAQSAQAAADLLCCGQQLAVPDTYLVVVHAQVDVHSIWCPFRVPAEHVHKRPRGGRSRRTRPEGLALWGQLLCDAGLGSEDCRDEISERDRIGHHGVWKSNVKRALQAKQQLHALETADTQVSLERVIKGRCEVGAAEFAYEVSSDGEELAFDVSLRPNAARLASGGDFLRLHC